MITSFSASAASKKINEMMHKSGVIKCIKKFEFIKYRRKLPFDVGARKNTVTIIVSVTPVVAASFKM